MVKALLIYPQIIKILRKFRWAKVVHQADGFIIFSHFKGHMETGFGGAIKNISMGFASRAQKQRMHADAKPMPHRG